MTQGINWEVKNLLGPTLFLTQVLYKKAILMTSADANIPPTAESYYWLIWASTECMWLLPYRPQQILGLVSNTSGHKSTLKPSLL